MKSKISLLAAALAVMTLLPAGVQAEITRPPVRHHLLPAGVQGDIILPPVRHFGFAEPLTYEQTNLVADTSGLAAGTDPLLVNPWGLAFQQNGAFWVADGGAGVATLYDGNGSKVQATFSIPSQAGGVSTPTGLIWNPTTGFPVPGTELPSLFVFATLQGTIAAWTPDLAVAPTDAVTAVDNSKSGAVYTGLATGVTDQGAFLYAANVHTGTIDVFDTDFQPANTKLSGGFADPGIPSGFVPFGIQSVEGNLVVTYALQNSAKTFVTPLSGAGFVDIFDTNGNFVQRVASGGELNAPWGVALAPAGFGGASGDIVVGNFGDGHILAFDQRTGETGVFVNQQLSPITLPGLWSLHFGGGADSDPRTLYFTVGASQGQHGLFGSLTPAPAPLVDQPL